MKIKDVIIRLNIISDDYIKLQSFKEKHSNKFIRLSYRFLLLFRDVFVGYLNMVSIINKMKCKNRNERPVKLAAVVIAKNESEYIAEWLTYHKIQGFEKIYLYDNDSDDNMKESLQPFIDSGFLVYHQIHGTKQQGHAYTHALYNYGKLCKYMAYIDCDEFLTPCNYGDNIIDILDRTFCKYPKAGGIAVNWCMFGSSHLENKPEGLLIENFVWRAKIGRPGTQIIKSVIKPECCLKWIHPHYPVYRLGYDAVDFDGNIVRMWENPIKEYKELMICHYFTKSKNQWIKRRAMGQASTGKNKPRSIDDFYRHDNNDVLDHSASVYSENVREILKIYRR